MKEKNGFLHNPPQDAIDAYHLLATVAETHGPSMASRIYAGSVDELRKAEFAKKYGVRLSNGRLCIQRLLGKQCVYTRTMGHQCDCTPPADDHPTLWNKDGKPLLWVSQPYGLDMEQLRSVLAFCDHYGLDVTMDTWPSWHFPSSVLTLLYRRKGLSLYEEESPYAQGHRLS